ncbi:hypothetical protein TgHK011_004178 [Trichoderma gracile]|nr:hypothetical protein TgHK011_004178 [Trichoderma gracile]
MVALGSFQQRQCLPASAVLTLQQRRSLEKLWELRRTAHEAPAANGLGEHADLRGMSPQITRMLGSPPRAPLTLTLTHPSSLSLASLLSLPRRSPWGGSGMCLEPPPVDANWRSGQCLPMQVQCLPRAGPGWGTLGGAIASTSDGLRAGIDTFITSPPVDMTTKDLGQVTCSCARIAFTPLPPVR